MANKLITLNYGNRILVQLMPRQSVKSIIFVVLPANWIHMQDREVTCGIICM